MFLYILKTVSYIKLNFKVKIDPKICTFKNPEELCKTYKKFRKNEWQPCDKV